MPKLDSRVYTNIVLTVIAALLLLIAAGAPVRLGLMGNAQAQESEKIPPITARQITEDPQMAAATTKVAEANREIAKQVGEVALAIKVLAKSVETSGGAK